MNRKRLRDSRPHLSESELRTCLFADPRRHCRRRPGDRPWPQLWEHAEHCRECRSRMIRASSPGRAAGTFDP